MCGNYNLVSSLARTALNHPDDLAISTGNQQISYGEFADCAARLAACLQPHIKNGRIGVLGSRTIAAYIGIAGTCWAGAAYVPLNLKWPKERLVRLLVELELDALVVDHHGAALMTDEVRAAAPELLIRSDDAGPVDGSISFGEISIQPLRKPVRREEEELGYIVFTSGTTGEPKGVMVSCGALAHYLEQTRLWTNLTAEDRIAEAHDVTFDLSVHNMFLAWRAGASLHLMSQLDMMMPQAFVRKHEISVWMSVPTIVNNMRRSGALNPGLFPSLRLSIFCGEPLAVSTVQDWAAAAPNSVVENIYGPTEGTVVCMRQRLTDPPVVTQKRQILAIGRAYENFCIAICDPDGNCLADGEVGEIALSSAQLADGYFNRPEQTQERFRLVDGKRWYFTGDLGYRDDNGIYHHMGRTDNQVKLKGNRIELEEVEMHLRKACGTDLACVVAWPVIDGSAQGLIGFTTSDEISEDEIKARMRDTLPEYMIPARIETRSELPRNINDKVDRNALVAELDVQESAKRKSMSVPSLRTGKLVASA